MNRYPIFILFALIFGFCRLAELQAQEREVLLYYENFDNPQDAAVTLNASNVITTLGPVRGNGDNKFRCGKGFDGGGVWPSVQRQSEHGARFANPDSGGYLYVGSERAMVEDSIDNANFDPTSTSDNFVVIGRGGPQMFCTRGLERVSVNFSWIGQGDRQVGQQASTELYYTQDGGRLWFPYMENGQRKPLIDENGRWNFTHEQLLQGGLSMPEWVDQSELAFGIRWMNARMSDRDVADSTGKLPISFGLDELRIHGVIGADVSNPIQIRDVPREICKGDGVGFQFRFMKPTCNCQLTVELSNPEGGFVVGATEIQTSPIGMPTWEGGVWYTFPASLASIPAHIQEGDRYCLRIVRRCDFPPFETASEVVCPISIKECPPKVQVTHKPPVSNDERKDTACVLSAFDVPFNTEIGVSRFFLEDNDYLVEISDEDGNWRIPPVYLPGGMFDELHPFPIRSRPGVIRSYIPEFFTQNPIVRFRPGCNYNVRVVSTSPQSVGSPWGPFCVRYCDIETNSTDMADLDSESGQSERALVRQMNVIVCVNDVQGNTIELPFDINEWLKLDADGKINGYDHMEYLDSNNFQLEVWAGTMSNGQLRLLHRGRIGSVEGTEGGDMRIRIPMSDSLQALQFWPTPGDLYMRIVADQARKAHDPDTPLEPYFPDMAGTFVRLVVGYPYLRTQLINLGNPYREFCEDETIEFDFGVHRFDASKQSCYQIVGKYFDKRPTVTELAQVRRAIESEENGAYDFAKGFYCPTEGWFTPGANFDYRPDPNQPSMRVGRHKIYFEVPEWIKGQANYVYLFARERNGASSDAYACYSDVSEGVPIRLIKVGFDDGLLTNQACVGEPFEAGLGLLEATVYDIRFVEPDDHDKRINPAEHGIQLLGTASHTLRAEFSQPGSFTFRAEAINRCGSIDVVHGVTVVEGEKNEVDSERMEVETDEEVEIDLSEYSPLELRELKVSKAVSGTPAVFSVVDSTDERIVLTFSESGDYEAKLTMRDFFNVCDETEVKQPIRVKSTSITPLRMTALLRVWPNPNGGSFHVAGLPETEAVELLLIDAMGREVARRPRQVYSGSCYWEVSGLTEGLYLVQAKSVNGVWRQRMIVQP